MYIKQEIYSILQLKYNVLINVHYEMELLKDNDNYTNHLFSS